MDELDAVGCGDTDLPSDVLWCVLAAVQALAGPVLLLRRALSTGAP
ncbi:hypothetical protein AB0I82_13750 [Streptomyces sp. NPDC050315]